MSMTDRELAKHLAQHIRSYRQSLELTQRELAVRTGTSLTSLARFEATGGVTLRNLIAILRGLGLADRLRDLVPDAQSPSPLALLQAAKSTPSPRARVRKRRNPIARTDLPTP